MPYILPEFRERLNKNILALAEDVKTIAREEPSSMAGNLNYIISKLLFEVYGSNPRYVQHNEAIGVLECAKLEWYRRKTAPYEDKKIHETGDVY